jgi:hypothetical protein
MITWGENEPLALLQIRLDSHHTGRLDLSVDKDHAESAPFHMSDLFDVIPGNECSPLRLPVKAC